MLTHWTVENDHRVWFTFIDSQGWSPQRELKIQGYIEITHQVTVELASLHMKEGADVYVFVTSS